MAPSDPVPLPHLTRRPLSVPQTARTLLAVLGRPGGGRGHPAEPAEQRERATGRRPARRATAASAAAADTVPGTTGAAPSVSTPSADEDM